MSDHYRETRRIAAHAKCKCGHAYGSHAAGGHGKCMSGYPDNSCACDKYRPRQKREGSA